MPTDLTARLAEARALRQKATKGPWKAVECGPSAFEIEAGDGESFDLAVPVGCASGAWQDGCIEREDDARFIAFCGSDLDDLLAACIERIGELEKGKP